MNKILSYITVFIVVQLLFSACTNSRWIVKETNAVDQNDYELLGKKEFLGLKEEVNSDYPVFKMQLYSENKMKYAEKVLIQRTIQEYELRPGFVVLGVTGAALSFFAANSSALTGNESTIKSIALNTTGLLMGVAGILNMKAEDEAEPTGEERYLRRTGSLTYPDTVKVSDDSTRFAQVEAKYGGRTISREERSPINSGTLSINIGSILNNLSIEGANPNQVNLSIVFNDSTYEYSYPLNRILNPYARVTAPVTLLKSSPETGNHNVLAELIRNSQLRVVEQGGEWHKVKYGLAENYIRREDVELLWRSSEFLDEEDVIAVPQIPFGSIDVENSIPILTGINPNAYGLVVSNQNYSGALSTRSYAFRDGRLVESYLESALGIDKISVLRDIKRQQTILDQLNFISAASNDSSIVVVYLNGYGSVKRMGDDYEVGYFPARHIDSLETGKAIDLSAVFEKIAGIQSQKTFVFADIEFTYTDTATTDISNLDPYREPLRNLSRIITAEHSRSAILFSSRVNQQAGLYVSKNRGDKKHHIFTYHLLKAIQNRYTNIAAINQYLERNVSYTSRRLFDKSQDPLFFGNVSLDLINGQ